MSLGNDIKKLNEKIAGKQRKRLSEEGLGGGALSLPLPLSPVKESNDQVEGSRDAVLPVEVFCSCGDHPENKILEILVPAKINQVFEMLNGDASPFMEKYNTKRGVKGSPSSALSQSKLFLFLIFALEFEDVEQEIHQTAEINTMGNHWKRRTVRYSMPLRNPFCMTFSFFSSLCGLL